jgi:hypothetical protein
VTEFRAPTGREGNPAGQSHGQDSRHPHRYHAVAEQGIPVADIAAAIGRGLDLPVAAETQQQVAKRFGFLAPFLGADDPASSTLTTDRLGWKPTRRSLLDDLQHGDYFTR